MEEEFQGGVCGGNWWNSSRNLFGSSPCSSAINDFGWFNHGAIADFKSTASLSSSTTSDDLNQDFLHDSGRSQENYSHILQAVTGLDSSMNYRRGDWNFSADSTINSIKQVTIEQQQSNIFTSFPLDSYNSSLFQNFFDTDSQPQQTLLDNQATNYSPSPMNSAEFQQHANYNIQFVNITPFWNATAAASGEARASFLPSTQPQLIPSSLSIPKLSPHNATTKHHNVKGGDTDSRGKKVGNGTTFKRPRVETPSPLPAFKVRKEKLGDRVTALQQLVSPFGKTDTASVLHEAIEYIKLLHDQVAVLSAPYLKNESPPLQRQQAGDNIKDQQEPMKDLRSRGLCLVPISSTFPVAAETTADFWTPTFGGSFR